MIQNNIAFLTFIGPLTNSRFRLILPIPCNVNFMASFKKKLHLKNIISAGEAIVAWRWGVWKVYISETGENTFVNLNLHF